MSTLLIVEDDKDIAEALSVRLTARGHTVYRAHDVVQGLNSAVKTTPDLVILDISMPGGNGFMFAERVQHIPEISHTPFVFMTASMDSELRQKAYDLGAKGFFEKPFDTNEFISCVEKFSN